MQWLVSRKDISLNAGRAASGIGRLAPARVSPFKVSRLVHTFTSRSLPNPNREVSPMLISPMLNKVVRSCALVAALSILAEPGVARNALPLHQGPIYNGVDHQPTENELRASHQHDVTPDQAQEIDRLYDQLLSSSDRILRKR
jgi:hypothetical protein